MSHPTPSADLSAFNLGPATDESDALFVANDHDLFAPVDLRSVFTPCPCDLAPGPMRVNDLPGPSCANRAVYGRKHAGDPIVGLLHGVIAPHEHLGQEPESDGAPRQARKACNPQNNKKTQAGQTGHQVAGSAEPGEKDHN